MWDELSSPFEMSVQPMSSAGDCIASFSGGDGRRAWLETGVGAGAFARGGGTVYTATAGSPLAVHARVHRRVPASALMASVDCQPPLPPSPRALGLRLLGLLSLTAWALGAARA